MGGGTHIPHAPGVSEDFEGTPSQADFKAQQRHLQQLVVSLDNALGALAHAAPSKPSHRPSTSTRTATRGDKGGWRVPRDSGKLSPATSVRGVTAESAAGLAVEALAAVKASLALTQHESGGNVVPSAQQRGGKQVKNGGGGRELRAALARAIGALRNACVGAASSTAELLGGEDPTGFAQEVKALADAHEKELEQAMAEDQATTSPIKTTASMEDSGVLVGGQGAAGTVAETEKSGGESGVGLDFWRRQSDLWSGVFAEQQTGLLQMVRAQEAELRQGKRRVSFLEQELSALNDKRAEATTTASAVVRSREERGRALGEIEADEWRTRFERMQLDYDRRLEALRERESTVAVAQRRVEHRAAELGAERDRLKAGAVALTAEADGIR